MVKIYSTKFCGACKNLKEKLTKAGVQFDDIDLSENLMARDEILSRGFMRVPVVQIGDEFMLGLDDAQISGLVTK